MKTCYIHLFIICLVGLVTLCFILPYKSTNHTMCSRAKFCNGVYLHRFEQVLLVLFSSGTKAEDGSIFNPAGVMLFSLVYAE